MLIARLILVDDVMNVIKDITIIRWNESVKKLIHFVEAQIQPMVPVLAAILVMPSTLIMVTVRCPSRIPTVKTSSLITLVDSALVVTTLIPTVNAVQPTHSAKNSIKITASVLLAIQGTD